MTKRRSKAPYLVLAVSAFLCLGADWTRFRGPTGSAISEDVGLPTTWSSKENIVWRTALPGPGTSCPITLGKRIYITSYSGYGLVPQQGDMKNLVRHLLCLDRDTGKVLWQKPFTPILPESAYSGGNSSRHGYASSTPVTDGERLYVFFGKSGVHCLDLDGNPVWSARVGDRTDGWGSSNSPILYKNLVIINASVESGALVALDKATGKEVWRTEGIRSSWSTPILVPVKEQQELVVMGTKRVLGYDPDSGKELWYADVFSGYICPSVVANGDIVYATNNNTVAVRAGGRGDVTQSHVLWQSNRGSKVASPVYHDGHLYMGNSGTVTCLNAKTGELVYQERLNPGAGTMYASPVLADGKLYYVSQSNGTYVIAAGPKFQQLAHNVFEDDKTRTNASPVVSNGQILLRTDEYLYCLGKRP
jgi:outer membrane protein assembly factor BamB